MSTPRIAIIGAGMAGITCARHLKDAALSPVVFEKSRGLGGRLATRRAGGGLAFDHGAQFVTARTAGFAEHLQRAAAPWRPRLAGDGDAAGWHVGAPTMNTLVKSAAADLDVRLQARVAGLERRGAGWRLGLEDGGGESFDTVVLAVPAPQAQVLAAPVPELATELAAVEMAPCWTLMLAFAEPLQVSFDVWRSRDSDIAWAGRDGARPGRDPGRECWVVQASARWSRDHRDADPDAVSEALTTAFAGLAGGRLPEIVHHATHRWLYARTESPLGRPFATNGDASLYAAGDWCLGARVEEAWLSGKAVAEDIVNRES